MKDIHFWLKTRLDLKEVSKILQTGLLTEPFEEDFEDVWEWISAASHHGGLKYRIARKHHEDQPDYDHPLIVHVTIKDAVFTSQCVDDLGRRLSRLLHADIHYGKATSLPGNEYQFDVEKTYEIDGPHS